MRASIGFPTYLEDRGPHSQENGIDLKWVEAQTGKDRSEVTKFHVWTRQVLDPTPCDSTQVMLLIWVEAGWGQEQRVLKLWEGGCGKVDGGCRPHPGHPQLHFPPCRGVLLLGVVIDSARPAGPRFPSSWTRTLRAVPCSRVTVFSFPEPCKVLSLWGLERLRNFWTVRQAGWSRLNPWLLL